MPPPQDLTLPIRTTTTTTTKSTTSAPPPPLQRKPSPLNIPQKIDDMRNNLTLFNAKLNDYTDLIKHHPDQVQADSLILRDLKQLVKDIEKKAKAMDLKICKLYSLEHGIY